MVRPGDTPHQIPDGAALLPRAARLPRTQVSPEAPVLTITTVAERERASVPVGPG